LRSLPGSSIGGRIGGPDATPRGSIRTIKQIHRGRSRALQRSATKSTDVLSTLDSRARVSKEGWDSCKGLLSTLRGGGRSELTLLPLGCGASQLVEPEAEEERVEHVVDAADRRLQRHRIVSTPAPRRSRGRREHGVGADLRRVRQTCQRGPVQSARAARRLTAPRRPQEAVAGPEDEEQRQRRRKNGASSALTLRTAVCGLPSVLFHCEPVTTRRNFIYAMRFE